MFVAEFVTGFIAESTGLIADSLDMLADATVYTPSREVRWPGLILDWLGLGAFPKNTAIDLWAARVGATDSEKVQFIVLCSFWYKLCPIV